MRFATKFALWLVVAAAVGVVFARPCAAQDEKGKEAAKQDAAQAESTEVAEHSPGDAKKDAEHGAEASHSGSSGPNPLGFDPDLAIFTVIVFLILFGFLSVFAWPQISAALVERERKIEDQIAAATAKHEDAKRLIAAHEAKLAAAAGEVRALLEEARRDADHTRKRIETEGHQAAKDELDRAIREIDRAKNGAIEELSKSTANVAIDLARHIVGDRITSDQQASIVREAMGKLAAASPSKN
jgi:F-type H+-transporting ATPase subunit b